MQYWMRFVAIVLQDVHIFGIHKQASLDYESIWHCKPASEQIYELFTSMFYNNTFCYIVMKYFDCLHDHSCL